MSTAASVGPNCQFRGHDEGIWCACPFKRWIQWTHFFFPMKLHLLMIGTISNLRLTICSVSRHLSSALCQHCRPLDTCSQYHGLSLGRHFLLFLAKNAGEHLPLGWSGPSVGPDGYTQLHLLHGTAGENEPKLELVKFIWVGSWSQAN